MICTAAVALSMESFDISVDSAALYLGLWWYGLFRAIRKSPF